MAPATISRRGAASPVRQGCGAATSCLAARARFPAAAPGRGRALTARAGSQHPPLAQRTVPAPSKRPSDPPTIVSVLSFLSLRPQVQDYEARIRQLEDDLLFRLSSSAGNLLDDSELVGILAVTKQTAQDVMERLAVASETRLKITAACEEYRPAARRAALLYFLVSQFSAVNCMYQVHGMLCYALLRCAAAVLCCCCMVCWSGMGWATLHCFAMLRWDSDARAMHGLPVTEPLGRRPLVDA